jgi:uncharacterized membrane protein
MLDALILWFHIIAAAVFVGPQLFLAAVAVPALRTIDDVDAQRQVSRRMTRGFGMLGGVALLTLLATGIWNYYVVEGNGLIDADAFPRYFMALQVKLTLVTVVIVLAAAHALLFGRRLQALQESGAGAGEIAAARRWSMLASIATLGVSLTILLCAALMGSDWSKQ